VNFLGRPREVATEIKQRLTPYEISQKLGISINSVLPYLGRALGEGLLTRSEIFDTIPRARRDIIMSAISRVEELNDSHVRRRIWDTNQGSWRSLSEAEADMNVILLYSEKLTDDFEPWVETLPFPLASILWRYHADSRMSLKNGHLLHFFEALAQFVTDLMLSAFYSDKTFFEENRAKWIEGDPSHPRGLRRSTFGNWVAIGERLAGSTRRMLVDQSQQDFCLNLYKMKARRLIDIMVDKDLFSILRAVNEYRNNWLGHGGVAGEKEEEKHLGLLERELTNFKQLSIGFFDQNLLLSPTMGSFSAGIYKYDVANLMGTRTIFRQLEVETSIPMEKGKLYLLEIGNRIPLELLPLFRIMPSPKTAENACYFYNRVEKEGVRLVSYHFEQEAEIVQPDDEILNIVRIFD
jgi:hypothetical protein